MRAVWDKIGISASLLCLIHCLFTPVIVIFLPFLGETLTHQWFHRIIVVIVLPVAVWALYNGYLIHKMKSVLYMGAAGLAFLIAAMTLGEHDFRIEYGLMIVAGLILAVAHLLNLRACRLDHR
jgi:hypothetical protein